MSIRTRSLYPSDLLLAITQQSSGFEKNGLGTMLEIRIITRLNLSCCAIKQSMKTCFKKNYLLSINPHVRFSSCMENRFILQFKARTAI